MIRYIRPPGDGWSFCCAIATHVQLCYDALGWHSNGDRHIVDVYPTRAIDGDMGPYTIPHIHTLIHVKKSNLSARSFARWKTSHTPAAAYAISYTANVTLERMDQAIPSIRYTCVLSLTLFVSCIFSAVLFPPIGCTLLDTKIGCDTWINEFLLMGMCGDGCTMGSKCQTLPIYCLWTV